MKQALNSLFEAKESIYKCLMELDMLKQNMMPECISKDQILHLFQTMKTMDIKLNNEQVFDIEKKVISYQQKLTIVDPKLYAKTMKNAQNLTEANHKLLINELQSNYDMLVMKCA